MSRRALNDAGVACGLCQDFGYLPGLGPCPHCHRDEHAEFLATLPEPTDGKENAV